MKKGIDILFRKSIICSMSFAMFIGIVACAQKESKSADTKVTKQYEKKEKVNYEQKAANLYNGALDKAESYDYEDEGKQAKEYKYSIVKMDGSKIPQLLISKKTEDRYINIKVFSYDKKIIN